MRKVKGLTNRIAAMFLSGLLVVGAVPGTVLASESPEDLGQTAETAAEDIGNTSEVSAEDMGNTLSEEVTAEGFSEDAALQGEEAAVEYYTVILDANGGYFENEWDDAIGEIVEQAQIVNKQVPIGGTVAAAPVFTGMGQDGQAVTFAGWSLEPDGELVTVWDEEYAPADSCTLYAVWEAEDSSAGDIGSDIESQDIAEENTDQIDASQDSVDVDEAAEGSQDAQNPEEAEEAEESEEIQGSVEADEAEGSATGQDAWDNGTAEDSSANENPASEADTDSETIDENEQAAAAVQEADYADEEAEKAVEESSDAAISVEEIQPELIGVSDEEETDSEDAVNGEVESGTCGDNLIWTLEEGTLTISGSGEISSYDYSTNQCLFADLVINTVIIEDGVTSIGGDAFYGCYGLTSITIPDSVTSIGYQAFYNCHDLTSITIPDSVTSIGYQAFDGCSSLTSIMIPGSVTSIGYEAFFLCSSLTSIEIKEGVTSFDYGAFSFCDSLESITIPNSVTRLSTSTFLGCSSLKRITISENVTILDNGMFQSCSSLESITIPKGVTSIGERVFAGCSSLKNILVEQGNQNYSSIGGVLFNSDQTVLVYYPCVREGIYTIPDSVTSIGNDAFLDCSNLTSIVIPNSVISIGDYAFFNCSSLTSITIPNSVTSIGDYAFLNCSNLTSITIPNSVTSIGVDAFKGCSNLLIYCYSGSKAHQYAKENNIPFRIFIGEASVTIPDQSYIYNGNPQKPKVTVIVNNTQLTEDTDYVVTYSDNIDAGSSATVTVTGTGDYYGEKEITFTIEQAIQPITASDLTLPYHESGKIMVTGNQGQLSYTSSDLSVAEVDTFGNVTAKKVGTATITITAAETKNYKKTEKEITVTVVKATQSITASDLSLTYMETGSVIVSGNVGDLTYESYHTNIATVYTNGKVTAMGAGDTKILITALETDNYKKTTKEITVNVAKAAQSITASDLSLTYPKTGTIKVSGNVGDLTYKSANEKVATVDADGKVTAAGAGDTKITITAAETDNYKKAAKEITVNVAKAAQSITVSNLTLAYPKTGTINVSGNEGKLTYESANEKVATVDTDGKVKAQGPGSAKITVTAAETANYKKIEKEITVTVVKGTQPVKASNLSLTYPNSGQITVSGNKGSLTYKSSDTSVATVDSAGKVTAKSGGTAKITITAAETAQYNAASKTITVNVARAAQSITAKASATVVFVGQTMSVSVTGAKGATSFKSSDTSIASVTSAGKVTAKKTGTVEITATSAATAQYNAASKTVTIKVVPAVTSSLTAANQVTGIKLTWKKVSGATGYKIYRNATLIKTITDGSTVTYTDAKANTNMSRYIYKVVAKGPAGDSPLARTVTAYRVNRPALSSVTNSAFSVMTVKWTRTARATGYQIKYSTSKNFASDNGTVSAYGAAADSRSIRGLTRGRTYYVKIRTYKIVGNGTYWSEWSPVRTVRISK